jgi:hypothetical protein
MTVRTVKSTSFLLTPLIPALGCLHSNSCCWGVQSKEKWCGDHVTDRMSASQQGNIMAWRIYRQSASTLQSGDIGPTLNFWHHMIKERQESVILGKLRIYQGSEQDVRVCVLWWTIRDLNTINEAVFCNSDVTYPPPPIFPVMIVCKARYSNS